MSLRSHFKFINVYFCIACKINVDDDGLMLMIKDTAKMLAF